MADSGRPTIYSIAAHRGFADALVAGLIPRYSEPGLGLARALLLLPSGRAVRTVTEAFVRASGEGLLLPRMVTIGDLDLDERIPALFERLGDDDPVPPAVDPDHRWLRLAALLADETNGGKVTAPILRQARLLARSLDRLTAEEVTFEELLAVELGELSRHWVEATRTFARVMVRWQAECAVAGVIDRAERRNHLLRRTAEAWRNVPPDHPVIAAGVTSAAPAVAALLRTVADLPDGAVVLPDLDLTLDRDVWDSLGRAGAPGEDGLVFARDDAVTHPQYHLKLLLNRMGLARDEVEPWHRAGLAAAPPERSRAISNMFLPPEASAAWIDLPPEARRMSGVRVMTSTRPEEEAQAIAVLVREALEVPARRVALVTPDRALAQRVIGHLRRWGVVANDTAGVPLSHTSAGRFVLALAEAVAEGFAPSTLLALLTHPLAGGNGEGRAEWLDRVRELDLILRGPRPEPGLDAVTRRVVGREKRHPRLPAFWGEVAAVLAPFDAPGDRSLGEWLAMLQAAAETLAGDALWAGVDGRALAGFVESLSAAAPALPAPVALADLAAALSEAMLEVAVRPPYGSHPRLTIYGLLEARMVRAELVICAGLTEGMWPPSTAPDPLLAPAILRQLGVPGADFRIGLAAHDLAGALGAPEVVLSHAERDMAGPTIPSRFLLRLQAMLGSAVTRETRAPALARALANAVPAPAYPRPRPSPTAEQRRVEISATALDRLRGDPYQFYASKILGLSALDPLDAELSPAERGTIAHTALEKWNDAGMQRGTLLPLAEAELARLSAHPLTRALWRPRLMEALQWIEDETLKRIDAGRAVLDSEIDGAIDVRGIRIRGRADRIDRLPGGALAVVDYKTGSPPGKRMVQEGFALQLGILGLIARAGGMEKIAPTPVEGFEYWSFGRRKDGSGFGFVEEPILEGRAKTGIPRDEFLPETERYLNDALDRWILGSEPFTARLNPDLPVYADYDQLMRLDEWQARGEREDREP